MTNTVQIPNDQMIFSVQELKDKGFHIIKLIRWLIRES